MTLEERGLLEGMRQDLTELRDAVLKHVARCDACRADIDGLKLNMYGIQGDAERPGVLGRLLVLEATRQGAKAMMRVVWGLLLVVLGGVITALCRSWF
jgi:hypothetical protein